MITIESSDDEDELHAALALSLQQPNNTNNNNDANNDSSDDEVEFISTNNTAAASSKQTDNANNHNNSNNHNNTSSKNHEDKITTLMSMGFNRNTCIQALQSTNGNLENAISFILSGTGDSSSSAVNDHRSSLTDCVANSKVSSSDIDKTAAVEHRREAVDSKQSATSTSNSNNKMSLADIRAEKHKRYLLSQQNNPSSTSANHPQQQQQSMNGGTSSSFNSQLDCRSNNGMSSMSSSVRASSSLSLEEGQVQVINNNLIDTNKHVHNDGGWIWVKNPTGTNSSRVDTKDNVNRLQAEFSSSLAGSNYTHEQLVNLARKHNVLTGKWLIDISPTNVHKDWPRIRNATLQSKLGCTAKISDEPVGNAGGYIVCIYCPDFTDKAEVLRVRHSLLRDVKIGENSMKPMYFKLDAFTHLNIYASSGGGGDRKMRTTTYDCGGAKDLDCTTLITAHETCTNSAGCPRCFPHCMVESSTGSTTDHPALNEDQTICTGLKLIIVGVQHREENLVALDRLTLEREPTNAYDDKAIVCKNGHGGVVGYVPKKSNIHLSPHLDTNLMRLDSVSLIRTTSTTLNVSVRLTLVDINERNKEVFLKTLDDLKVKFPQRRTKKKAKTSKTSSSLLDDDGDKKPEANPEARPNGKLSFRDHSTSSDSSIPITIVSWNVSEFDNPISARAPNPLQRMRESSNLIRAECFNHSTYLPDVIALQETSDSYWGTKTFGSYGYASVGSTTSHCGIVDLLIRKDFLQGGDPMRTPPRLLDSYNQLPSIAAIITLPNKTQVAVSSSHLAPSNDGAASREESIRSLVGSLSRKCDNVITIGDMNMRVAEDDKIEEIAGDDAWKVMGSSNESKSSWNVFVNPYHENGFRNRARYDRCFVKGDGVTVTRFDLIGNTPVDGVEGDYLSDHFGIIVEVTVKPPTSPESKRGNATTTKAKQPHLNNYQQHTRISQDIMPIKPTRSPPLVNSNKAQRYIIYMAIHEEHGSKFEQGLAKCKEACHADIQHCLQMDGTRHVTMYDGNMTSDQFRGLSFTGQFESTEISLQGWCSWDAGCYLQLDKQSIQCLKSLLSRITGLPSSGGKRPCDHLSLYRKRPNTMHPNPKQAFAKIRDATRNVDFGSVKGVSIRIKTLGSPYDECLVLAESSTKGEKTTSDRFAKAKPPQLKHTRDTSDSDYEGVKESEETLQRANGKRAKLSAAAAADKKKEQKKQASMVVAASKKKKSNVYDSSSDEDDGFDEMKRKLLAKRAAASRPKDASSSDDEVQVIQKKSPVHSPTNEKKRKAPPPPSSSSSSEDEEEEFDYEAYAREAAARRAKARGI